MIRIILCEGKTDAVLLSYYLGRTKGWVYKDKSKSLKLRLRDQDNQYLGHYAKDEEELHICGVGGKDNFVNFYQEYIEQYMISGQDMETEYKLAIVVDRDDEATEEIEAHFAQNLGQCISDIKDGTWTANHFINSFGQEATVSLLCVIIPQREQGALETVLLKAISEDLYKKNLIDKSAHFVDDIYDEAKEIITNERLKLKTKLGVSLAVLYPQKVFSLIDEQIKNIPWENSVVLKECFNELVNI